MCLNKTMRDDLALARTQLFDLMETLSRLSECVECHDIITCQDGYFGNVENQPPVTLNGFVVPSEATPLTMAARLHSWITALDRRLDHNEAAKN